MIWGALGMLAWGLPVAAAVIALYFLRMKRRDLEVPATFLWPALTEEIRANSLFQRIKPNILLLLQLLALAMIALALARPQIASVGLGGGKTVAVIDTSASMQATDVKPSRMGVAISKLKATIGDMQAVDQMTIIEAGPHPRVLCSFSSDKAVLLNALDRINPSDADSDVAEAMLLASSLCLPYDNAKIALFSDGVYEDLTDFRPGRASVDFISMGESGENIAIGALSVNETKQGRTIFTSVRNYGGTTRSAILRLRADGAIVASTPIKIVPHGTFAKSFPAPQKSAVVQASLETDATDAIAADNEATVLADPNAKVSVLMVGDDWFLERALALEPRVVLDKAKQLPSNAKRGGDHPYDLVVFVGGAEEATNARAVLSIGTTKCPIAQVNGQLVKPTTGSVSASPITQDVNLQNVFYENAPKVAASGDAKVVAKFESGDPLILFSANTSQPRAYVAVNNASSDFALKPSFPILISNLIETLSPPGAAQQLLCVAPGQSISLTATGDRAMTIMKDGKDIGHVEPSLGRYVVRNLLQIGTYTLDAPSLHRTVYVSGLTSEKSDCRPKPRILLGEHNTEGRVTLKHFADKWPYLAAFALAVLCLEWFAFLRRS